VAGVLAGIAAILGVLSLFVFGWYRDNYSSVSGGNNASSSSKFPASVAREIKAPRPTVV